MQTALNLRIASLLRLYLLDNINTVKVRKKNRMHKEKLILSQQPLQSINEVQMLQAQIEGLIHDLKETEDKYYTAKQAIDTHKERYAVSLIRSQLSFIARSLDSA